MSFLHLLTIAMILHTSKARGPLTREENLELTKLHNQKRAIVSPQATAMNELTFSDDLAKSAQDWANECIWKHGQKDTSRNKYKEFGQNLYVSKGTYSSESAVFMWDEEKKDFTYSSNYCVPNKMCGHYTQVVWAETTLVGCALKTCETMQNLAGFNNAHYLVCHYHFPGNLIINHVPQHPYETGKPCSKCSAERPYCDSNLCTANKKGSFTYVDKNWRYSNTNYKKTKYITFILIVSMNFL